MSERSCLSIILAAGEGTRMKSALPKVLHEVARLPMLAHVANAAARTGGNVAIVTGHGSDQVNAAAQSFAPNARTFVQAQRLGTAHAVLAARSAIAEGYDDLLVMFGDTPLIEAEALAAARRPLASGAAVVVMGFRTENPTGYGRLIEDRGELIAIREERDCSEEERRIKFCNGGLMAIAGEHALELLDAVGNTNAKGEYYLTDIVEIARARGLRVLAEDVAFENVLGINTRVELAEAEAIWQRRKRRQMMLAGVTLVAPETAFFSHDTEIGQDTIVEPNVYFGAGVKVAAGVVIHAFSHLEGATVATGAEVGPYARLRPGADLRDDAKVGNFCEVKKAVVEKGAKVNHLTYIGDARIGAGANIGAGTITCNYDGFSKFFTDIGPGAFIGSNSSLVAPVTIGAGAYVASGSTIVESVPADALAFGRARQTTLPDRGKQLRERLAAAKKVR
ncbi:bifunctional UDP-N-acetylglucosamine diphosphorylase/glucosamine-1-phosphate N-acetyltransferase GlmU [Arvimicrobium flavum]|uniref:bifunctional UDP-N-acetylglucosamine diphosphorylase/glucosamine-1-phosphate N-acetyltransferase GlmU n=1 Tax=Arvimicrobium flavum TaxID=3393320 RepID=UPI00237B4422|nr:bifunctional UDP-N-acetylglucosamine diphosphorylase/glucosamine-1-phosphate N-acetyltransferase GlmU [Mesorhizobium shangrilense]